MIFLIRFLCVHHFSIILYYKYTVNECQSFERYRKKPERKSKQECEVSGGGGGGEWLRVSRGRHGS